MIKEHLGAFMLMLIEKNVMSNLDNKIIDEITDIIRASQPSGFVTSLLLAQNYCNYHSVFLHGFECNYSSALLIHK